MIGGDVPFYVKTWRILTTVGHPPPCKTPIFDLFSLVASQP